MEQQFQATLQFLSSNNSGTTTKLLRGYDPRLQLVIPLFMKQTINSIELFSARSHSRRSHLTSYINYVSSLSFTNNTSSLTYLMQDEKLMQLLAPRLKSVQFHFTKGSLVLEFLCNLQKLACELEEIIVSGIDLQLTEILPHFPAIKLQTESDYPCCTWKLRNEQLEDNTDDRKRGFGGEGGSCKKVESSSKRLRSNSGAVADWKGDQTETVSSCTILSLDIRNRQYFRSLNKQLLPLESWTSSLSRLCLQDAEVVDNKVFRDAIDLLLTKDRFTHLSIIELELSQCLIHWILDRVACRKSPLHELTLGLANESLEPSASCLSEPENDTSIAADSGLVHLHFRNIDQMSTVHSRYICRSIQNNSILTKVTLTEVTDLPLVERMMTALIESHTLTTLELYSVDFGRVVHLQEHIISLINAANRLRSITFDNCDLSPDFVRSDGFVTAITSHPELTQLNVSNNQLGKAALVLLSAIVTNRATNTQKFNLLDLSHNDIPLSDILTTLDTLHGMTAHQRKFIHTLDLSGNIEFGEYTTSLWEKFHSFVDLVLPGRVFNLL